MYPAISLPTDGRSFRAFVEIGFSAARTDYETGATITASGGSFGSISFYFSEPVGLYYPSDFHEVPEPATLEFVATGLVSILALARKELRM